MLVTFGDMISPTRDDDFFSAGPARKAGIACAGITAKAANWYPAASMRAAAGALAPLTAAFGHRVLYGGSMGGYAALKFSRLLDATTVIALCPQWSIDPGECEGRDPGFQNHFLPVMAGMGVRGGDIAGEIFVFADRGDAQEAFHCRMIARACPDVTLIPVPMAGHHVTSIFAGSQNLLRLIAACESHDKAALNSFVRDTRRRHWIRLEEIIRRAPARHAARIAGIVAARSRNEPHVARLATRNLLRIAGNCLRTGHGDTAAWFVTRFRDGLDDPNQQLLAASVLNNLARTRARIVTHHATRLVFDFSTRTCRHKAGPVDTFEAELQIHLTGAAVTMFIEAAGLRIDLSLDENRNLVDRTHPPRMTAAQFQIASPRAGSFTLRHDGLFLSAERGGAVVCNRPEAGEWEYFRAR